jgi:hypothetical protein
MTQPKVHLNYAEFYITNVCNLACTNCNRFNDQDFRGRYDFDESLYGPWSQRLDLHRLAILGGEPTYHPGLISWVEGLTRLWPDTFKMLITNGTRLEHPGLHEALARHGWELEINLHQPHATEFSRRILASMEAELGPMTHVEDGCWGKPGVTLRSSLGVTVFLRQAWQFHASAIRDYDTMETHDSDPERSHSLCTMKKCHHFFDGQLYKCGVARLLPDLLDQRGITKDPRLTDYRPMEVGEVTDQSIRALGEQSISPCFACSDRPEDWYSQPLETLHKRDLKP